MSIMNFESMLKYELFHTYHIYAPFCSSFK